MDTYFAIHSSSLDIDSATYQHLWDGHYIAVHYPNGIEGLMEADNESLELNSYGGSARNVMARLVRLATNGGYVCAQYLGQSDVLIGQVQAGTTIELIRGTWGSKNGLDGRPAVLKGLKLTRVKQIHPSAAAVIIVGRPRQGTLSRWWGAGQVIRDLVEGVVSTHGIMDLTAAQQEVLCAEYLRLDHVARLGLPRLAHLVLPTGRTMKDVDIIGLASDGRKIFAQVTYHHSSSDACKEKLSRLMRYHVQGSSCAVMFCNAELPSNVDGIVTVPLKMVVDEFRESPLGSRWLRVARGEIRD